jgi:hypothetical protein
MRFTYPCGAKPLAGYTIKRGVGRGGFGEVYYATSDAGKEVALKLIRRNLDIELRGVTHCLNLKHPNLLSIFDIRHDDEGDAWVVMEYITGESLQDAMERNPTGMSTDEAMHWFCGTAAGVACLHENGIVHRDLKPGNVFSDQGIVKVGDYGLSKFISCSRRSGQTESVGTVHYMAPEIANGRYGHQIDVYALGVMLYEMLTGRVPFEGESVGEVLMKHLTAEPKLDGIREPFRSLIARALDKDPEQRFRSVADMVAAISRSGVAGAAGVALGRTGAAAGRSGAAVGKLGGNYPGAAAGKPGGNIGGAGLPGQPANRDQARPRLADAGGSGPAPAPADSPQGDVLVAEILPSGQGGGGDLASQPEPSLAIRAPGARAEPADGYRAAQARQGERLPPPDEEPIAKLVREVFAGIGRFSASQEVPAFTKLIVLGVPILVLAATFAFWLPLVAVLLLVYAVYWTIRAVVLSVTRSSPRPESQGSLRETVLLAGSAETPWDLPEPPGTRRERLHWMRDRERPLAAELIRSPRERLTELLGSLLGSTALVLIVTTALFLFRGGNAQPQQFAWVALVSLLAVWAILPISKFWEGRHGEALLRRLCLLGVGMGVGMIAYGSTQWLLVELPYEWNSHRDALLGQHEQPRFATVATQRRSSEKDDAPSPETQAFARSAPPLWSQAVYLGFLLAGPAWWYQTDRRRTRRLGLIVTIIAVGWAYLLSLIWAYPQPWGLMVAAAVSISIQLASPWDGSERRSAAAAG